MIIERLLSRQKCVAGANLRDLVTKFGTENAQQMPGFVGITWRNDGFSFIPAKTWTHKRVTPPKINRSHNETHSAYKNIHTCTPEVFIELSGYLSHNKEIFPALNLRKCSSSSSRAQGIGELIITRLLQQNYLRQLSAVATIVAIALSTLLDDCNR